MEPGVKKMKNMKLAVFLIIVLTVLTVIPVNAERGGIDYKANGKLVEYGEEQSTSEVVNGRWDVKVKGEKAEFKAFYRERNLDITEDSPIGSIDVFWIFLTELNELSVNTDTGECIITGEFMVVKKWWLLPENPDNPPRIKWLKPQWNGEGQVTITPNECVIEFWAELKGPTLAVDW
jgi:hypothetical protein